MTERPTNIIVSFHIEPSKTEILLALLAGFPFDAFEEKSGMVITGIKKDLWNKNLERELASLSKEFNFKFEIDEVPEENWNAIWEASFKEVIIDDFCQIRAAFHLRSAVVTHSILIEPRMAFGTGHHETTRLMIRALSGIEKMDSVVDFGAGSGLLAILAAKMGAQRIWAVECDQAAHTNLLENIEANGVQVTAHLSDNLNSFNDSNVQVVLANITRNVITDHAADLVRILRSPGSLIVSGFLARDRSTIEQLFIGYGLELNASLRRTTGRL